MHASGNRFFQAEGNLGGRCLDGVIPGGCAATPSMTGGRDMGTSLPAEDRDIPDRPRGDHGRSGTTGDDSPDGRSPRGGHGGAHAAHAQFGGPDPLVRGLPRFLGSRKEFDGDTLSGLVRAAFAPGGMLQGRYSLIRELGRGGMGLVFLGHDLRLDRPVAIKVVLPRAGDDGAGLDLSAAMAFADEARIGASLTHPAIATVFDFGLNDGAPFTVFEYIPGETLRDLLRRRGRLELDEVRMIVATLAQALDFAHGRRVVHRDLKPENVRATEQGQFKVLDLGLAKDFRRQEDWTFCGTPAYASPEQARGEPCDGRADQYALAVIAFEMLAGRRPFEGKSWRSLLEMHATAEPPRPSALRPDLPDAIGEAILRALDKDPNRRFATCEELAVALGCQFLALGPGSAPRDPSWRPTSRS